MICDYCHSARSRVPSLARELVELVEAHDLEGLLLRSDDDAAALDAARLLRHIVSELQVELDELGRA